MIKLTVSDHPETSTLDVGSRRIVFTRVTGNQYTAELDGTRVPIRTTREVIEYGRKWPATVCEGESANIDAFFYSLALGAVSEPLKAGAPGVTLHASENWGHYRQWTYLTITVTITPVGMVEIHERIDEMDESYY